MSGQKIESTWNYLGIVLLFAALCFPAITISISAPSIHVLDLAFPLLVINIWLNRSKLQRSTYLWTPFLLAGYVLISILIQGHKSSMSDFFEIYKWLKYGVLVLFFTLQDFTLLKRFIPWLLGILILINVLHFFNCFDINSILEKYYNGGLQIHFFGKDSDGAPAVKRLIGTMGNPNVNAILFGFFSIVYFPSTFQRKKVLIYLLCLLFVFLCQSRTALLSLVAMLGYLAIFQTKIWTKKQWLMILSGMVLSFLLAWMFATSFFQYTSYNNSLLNGSALHSGSARGRYETWKLLGKMVIQEPIFGHGPFKNYFYTRKIYSENEYILMAWRYGIIGLIAYLSIYFIPLKKIFRSHESYFVQGTLLLILMTVSATTNNPLTERNIEFLFAIGIAGILKHSYSTKNAHAEI